MSACAGRPLENARSSRMIAATSNTRVAATPKVEKNSTKPPAMAANSSCLLTDNSAEHDEGGGNYEEKEWSPGEAHTP